MAVSRTAATTNPIGGEMTSEVNCLLNADHLMALRLPTEATPEPTRPPISACVELLGRP